MGRLIVGLMIVALVLPALLTPAAAAAQVAGTRQLANGQTLSWSDFYQLDQQSLVVGDGYDIVDLNSPLGIVRFASTDFAVSGSELRDIVIEDLQAGVVLDQVDRGDYDNVSYSLDTTNIEGTEVGIFTLVVVSPNSTLLTMLITPLDIFQLEMEIAQEDITIGGTGIFEGVDAAVMQQHLTRATGVAPANTNQSTASLPNSYLIPSSGVTVSWSDAWTVSLQDGESIQLESSAPVALVDVLHLGTLPVGTTAQALGTSLLQQPGYESSQLVLASDVVPGQRMLLAISQPSNGGPVYLVYDIRVSSGTATATLLSAFQADISQVVDQVSPTVQVDGQPIFSDLRQLAPQLFA